jgi:hypothetical protein
LCFGGFPKKQHFQCAFQANLHTEMTFLMKTSETKKFVNIFSEAFLIFKKHFASTIQDLFPFLRKDFLNSQAVRIMVKSSGA